MSAPTEQFIADFTQQFLTEFPEFNSGNLQLATPPQVMFWYGVGDLMLNENRWGDFRDYGLKLFIAHNLTLQSMNVQAANSDSPPGFSLGTVSSQSVGGMSVSTDSVSVAEQYAGSYGLTVYGNMFLRLSRIVGIGGLQL